MMRQVNHDELVSNIRQHLSQLPASMKADLSSAQPDCKRRGEAETAVRLAAGLARYEVLSSAPLNHPAGDNLFAASARRDLPGEVVGSGVPSAGADWALSTAEVDKACGAGDQRNA